MNPRTLVLVPALNERDAIADVVTNARSLLGFDVLVVDDGSTDDTGDVAVEAGALVLTHPFNLGVGSAIRTGLDFAATSGYDRVVQIDGDGQHPPLFAKQLLGRLDEGYDLVIGSRFGSDYHVGFGRRLAMGWLARIASRNTGATITDATSGFRAFGPAALQAFEHHYPSAYLSDTVEALLIAGQAGLRVVEEPVEMHDRQGGSPSASILRSASYLARLFLVILVHPVRAPRSARR